MGFELRTEDIVAYLAKWLKIQEEAKKNVWINGCNNCVKMASEQGPGDQEIANVEDKKKEYDGYYKDHTGNYKR